MSSSSRPTRVRSAPLKNDIKVADQYNRIGLALAVFAALCFFCVLWGVNGFFTARTVRNIGPLLGFASMSWGAGWLVHIVVSLIEHHLWRLRHAVGGAPSTVVIGTFALILLVGILDVLTSTFAFLLLFVSLGADLSDPSTRFVSVMLAEIIAIIPEPIIVWLAVALWRVIRG